ncbi:hypothetical protein [Shewanella sp. Iso12]|nr:hypothetical protein [Shewanella sp. Iso12]
MEKLAYIAGVLWVFVACCVLYSVGSLFLWLLQLVGVTIQIN